MFAVMELVKGSCLEKEGFVSIQSGHFLLAGVLPPSVGRGAGLSQAGVLQKSQDPQVCSLRGHKHGWCEQLWLQSMQ